MWFAVSPLLGGNLLVGPSAGPQDTCGGGPEQDLPDNGLSGGPGPSGLPAGPYTVPIVLLDATDSSALKSKSVICDETGETQVYTCQSSRPFTFSQTGTYTFRAPAGDGINCNNGNTYNYNEGSISVPVPYMGTPNIISVTRA
jgi:hypothetical protein